MAKNPVTHFEVIGKDGKQLQDFFSGLFGWKVDANNPMNYGMTDPGETGIGGGIASGQEGEGARVTVYVEVDDLPAYLKKAEGLGGKTLMPPMQVPGGPEIAMLADPAGNTIGLLKAGSMQG
jgi:predicted enzyme related to lactoylglutathione lyase